MKNLTIVAVVVVIVLIGGLFLINSSGTQAPESPEAEESMVENDKVDSEDAMMEQNITLSEQNDSGQSGTAILKEVDGQVVVSVNVAGFEEGIAQPAHIHIGSCPDVGAVSYPLTSVVDGVSETTLDVTIDQLTGEQPLAINVHKSADEASVYVACGDLNL